MITFHPIQMVTTASIIFGVDFCVKGYMEDIVYTVKGPKWIHFWDEWIQALSQWAARIFLIFKNQRKYCILIGLELYPFTSKVYPFGNFTGTAKKVIELFILGSWFIFGQNMMNINLRGLQCDSLNIFGRMLEASHL